MMIKYRRFRMIPKEVLLTRKEVKLLETLLDSGDMEDLPIELCEDKIWSAKDFKIFNGIRVKFGLEPLEAIQNE
jgi:hypothetical protein